MRCKNCGYVNDDSVSKCIKCGAELGNNNSYSGTEHNASSANDNFVPSATIHESAHTGGILDNGTSGIFGKRHRPEPSSTSSEMNDKKITGTLPPNTPVPKNGGTINPWLKQRPSECFLQPMDSTPEKTIACSGESFELTRDNTNPDDRTISSHQAVLTHDSDGWYIEDCSTYQTTSIVARRRMRLESGDIVVLGSSRFVFSDDDPKRRT